MSKPFRFKQFSVADDRCTHKVGTDAVLLGSWVQVSENDRRFLDIGTGSGVIALMLAQRSHTDARIEAIEIGRIETEQAEQNVRQSPWPEKVVVHNIALQDFKSEGKFDLIVSNPPYFERSLLPPDPERIRARHTHQLSFDELLEGVVRLMLPRGRVAVVLPFERMTDFSQRALAQKLFPSRITHFRTRKHKAVERVLAEFKFEKTSTKESELILYSDGEAWSEEYRNLTRDFYLKS